MKYLYEKKLVQKLDKILKKKFGTNLSFREFSAGYGIADLVFAADFDFRRKKIRRSPITNFACLSILLSLQEKNNYSLSEILRAFPQFTDSEIKKQLKNLTASGYIEKSGNDSYKKIIEEDDLNPIKKIIAIEVKLSDHKNGLIQARRYQYFADESYLAILKSAEKNINFNEFDKYNIGLILFDEKTSDIEIRKPKQKNDNCEQHVSLFAKEMMLSRFMSFSS